MVDKKINKIKKKLTLCVVWKSLSVSPRQKNRESQSIIIFQALLVHTWKYSDVFYLL